MPENQNLKEGKPLKNPEIKRKSAFREYAEAILVALVLALLIRTFIVQAFKIPSGSMEPTLEIGDHILVNKFIYGVKIPFTGLSFWAWEQPQREDVVVFAYPLEPEKDFIKRVIAVEGDTVKMVNKKLYINGAEAYDPHAVYKEETPQPGDAQKRDNFGPVTVPPGKLFVLGDNRDRSLDSRFWGFVPVQEVKGKAFIVYFSGSMDFLSIKVRWNRIGHLIR
ncbi:MAG: signal peptidase I [Deltaproteobacteria bacterium]|jgi:signal peptidase I|nr:signal peptidase I [Deltaproteobacteria bacterium]